MRLYKKIKCALDFLLALSLITLMLPFLILLFLLSSYSTKSFGIFIQKRIGYKNKTFKIYKFKTMIDESINFDFVTDIDHPRITIIGRFLRRLKLDELPQLFNILLFQMSFVGPRPDVPGFAELLPLEKQYLLKVRPGITSNASLYFRDEEIILNKFKNNSKLEFNNNFIWPIKIELNNFYANNFSFLLDVKIILQTMGILNYKKFDIKN